MLDMDLLDLSKKLNKVCRLCFKECVDELSSVSVFSKVDNSEVTNQNILFVYEILQFLATTEIKKDDCLPKFICLDCMQEAHQALKFKYKLQEADVILSKCVDLIGKIESEETDYNGKIVRVSDLDDVLLEETLMIKVEPDVDITESNTEHVHKTEESENIEDDYYSQRCLKCDNVFPTQQSFMNHNCVKQIDRVLCPHCGKIISKSYYSKHLYMHTGRKDYMCHICNKAFNASGTLKFHIASHTGEKAYLCTLCGKRFTQPTGLKYHMRFHNNERRYKCDICGKAFVIQSHLVEHKRKHTGAKPNVCTKCGKGFARRVELRMHNFLHTGQKPFKCNLCEKSFARKTHMRLHEMTHSGHRPHVCSVCGKGFIQLRPLRTHMRIHELETK